MLLLCLSGVAPTLRETNGMVKMGPLKKKGKKKLQYCSVPPSIIVQVEALPKTV